VLFLSDRARTMNLFAYDVKTRAVTQLTRHDDFDVKSFDARGDLVVYEQAGRPPSPRARERAGDAARDPARRRPDGDAPPFEPALPYVQACGLSPTGVRAVFEARGDLFTVPAKKGDVRNVTRTPGVFERSARVEPRREVDRCFSDEGGEYQLALHPQDGIAAPRKIALGRHPSFYYSPIWSPDGKRIAYTDKRLQLWCVAVDGGKPLLVDTDSYDHPQRSLDPAGRPTAAGSRTRSGSPIHLRAVFVWDAEQQHATQVTDGRGDASSVVFTRDGKALCFLASTNVGLNVGWLDMSSYERPVRASVYLVVLDKDAPSPLAPERRRGGGEGAGGGEGRREEGRRESRRTADGQEGREEGREAGADQDRPRRHRPAHPRAADPGEELGRAAGGPTAASSSSSSRPTRRSATTAAARRSSRFDLKERKLEPFLAPLARGFWLSGDGKKLLTPRPTTSTASSTSAAPRRRATARSRSAACRSTSIRTPSGSRCSTRSAGSSATSSTSRTSMAPDWPAVCRKYQPFLAHVGHRADLAYLFSEMIGELVIGHATSTAATSRRPPAPPPACSAATSRSPTGRIPAAAASCAGRNWNPPAFLRARIRTAAGL
jgi:tricorn protease